MADMEVNLMPVGTAAPFKITVPASATVLELKQAISQAKGIPTTQQKLIYAGRVLQDAQTLTSYSYTTGNTIHLVESKPKPAASQQSATPSTTTTTNRTTTTTTTTGQQPPPNPMNPFGMGMGMGMGGTLADMQQQMASNPDMMRQMLDNPMVQSMMQNPDFMQQSLMANPETRRIMEQNPELGRMMTDPEVLRQSMEMARNPALRDEMMRNQDRAISNLESMPGGHKFLRRMHQDIQEPLMDAMSGSGQPAPQSEEARRRAENPFIELLMPPAARPPNTTPLSNPWASSTSSTTTGTRPPPMGMGGLFGAPPTSEGGGGGGTGTSTGGAPPNPFAMPGMGMGGMPGGPPPEHMLAMLENPMFRQQMQMMMSNPQMVEHMIQSNPMLSGNPAMAEQMRMMAQNPQLMEQALDPNRIRLMSQLMQAQGGGGGAGLFGAGGVPGSTSTTSSTTTTTGGQQPTTTTPPPPAANPFASMFGGGGVMPPVVPQPPGDPREMYATQLEQMRNMGFFDEAANIRVLQATQGNVSAAVDRLLQQFGG